MQLFVSMENKASRDTSEGGGPPIDEPNRRFKVAKSFRVQLASANFSENCSFMFSNYLVFKINLIKIEHDFVPIPLIWDYSFEPIYEPIYHLVSWHFYYEAIKTNPSDAAGRTVSSFHLDLGTGMFYNRDYYAKHIYLTWPVVQLSLNYKCYNPPELATGTSILSQVHCRNWELFCHIKNIWT